MFRAFDAGACVGDDRRSAMPAVRGVVALLNRLSAGERTASCFAPEARLREGPFPGITATRTTLDAQLEVVAREYEIDAWAEAVNLSADGQVLVSGVHAAKPLAHPGGFAEAFTWIFGCDETGRIRAMTVLAGHGPVA